MNFLKNKEISCIILGYIKGRGLMKEITYENVFDENVIEKDKFLVEKNKKNSEIEEEFYSLFIVKDHCVLLCEDRGYFYFPTYPKKNTFVQIRRDLFEKGFYSLNEDNALLYCTKDASVQGNVENVAWTFYLSGYASEDFLKQFSNASFIPMDEVSEYLSSTISLDERRNDMDQTILHCIKAYLGKEKDREKSKLKLKEF